MKKVVFILGPTAVGKSSFGICLAKKFDGEIISADSVQIYRGLDIGSAKITDTQDVVHHGIDILNPNETFSAYEFVQYTRQKIDEIISRGKLPIVVGGTGLYIKAFTEGYNFGGVDKDEKLRGELETLAKEKGNDYLFDMLKKQDLALAEKTDKFNTVRLIRALEIALSKGEKAKVENDIDALVIALNRDREEIYRDINARVDEMLKLGLVDEVEKLKTSGLTKDNQSMRAIGYKEVLDYLDGTCDYETMVEKIKQHSRNYAKRQLTFIRGMKDCRVVDVTNMKTALEEVCKLVGEWL